MTRLTFLTLFTISIVISSSVQLQCMPGEVEDDCPSDCVTDYCPTKEHEMAGCIVSKGCGKPKCKCAFNTKRALNGTCIDTRNCPPFNCHRPNEEYVACPPLCPQDDCRQSTADGKCPIYGYMLVVVECAPACRCIRGYWRHRGQCVPYHECPQHARLLPIFFKQ